MSEVNLPDEWWIHLSDEEAAPLVLALQGLIQLRIAALDDKMKTLLSQIRMKEMSGEDVASLSEEYSLTSKRKRRLSTKEGELEFMSPILQSYYEQKKTDKESLPI